MAKSNKNRKPPSRQRYDEGHRVRSVRLDREHNELLDKLLEGAGWSYSDFVKAHIRKDAVMVERRIETLASRQVNPLFEGRLKCMEDLVRQIFISMGDMDEFPPRCPHCDGQELIRCAGRQMASNSAQPWVATRKCPKCGFFIDTYKRIDPKSITWLDLRYAKPANKPKVQPDAHEKHE